MKCSKCGRDRGLMDGLCDDCHISTFNTLMPVGYDKVGKLFSRKERTEFASKLLDTIQQATKGGVIC